MQLKFTGQFNKNEETENVKVPCRLRNMHWNLLLQYSVKKSSNSVGKDCHIRQTSSYVVVYV